MTGKTTTRNRSTRPAARSDRHRVRLPSVLMLGPLRFIAETATTASPLTSSVLAHGSGPLSVDENTFLGRRMSSSFAAPSAFASDPGGGDSLANPYPSRTLE